MTGLCQIIVLSDVHTFVMSHWLFFVISLNPLTFAFLHPVSMPIIGQPTNKSILCLKQEIYANTKLAHSLLCGGIHGHLALVLPAATYISHPGAAVFIPPIHPGAPPEHVANTTQFVTAEGNCQYQAAIVDFTRYTSVKEHLCSQLIEAIPHTYINILKDVKFGFGDIECSIIKHGVSKCGKIMYKDMKANCDSLEAEWTPTPTSN
jgi:hypothetical protein